MRTLPNDCHRCDGDRNYKQDLRQPCDTCLRALAPLPKEGSWYSKFMGVPIRDGECDYYWKAK